MNTKLLKRICLFSTLALGSVANGQLLTKVTVQKADASENYTMYSSGKMYFADANLVIDTIGNGNIITTKLKDIDKLLFSTFEYDPTGDVKLINDASALAVSPSAATDQISITGLDGTFKFQILNVSGRTIAEGSASAGDAIDVTSFPKGVYFVRINGSILKFAKL